MKQVRTTIDILMVIALPLLMAYSLLGENNHEVIGICMLAVFLVHHIINRRWWMSFFKGKYSITRITDTIVNLLLAVYMILQPVSGILMSKHVLTEVTINGAAGTLRTVHMTMAYWGFILLSFHLGLHVRRISASFKKNVGKGTKIAITVVALLISAYGVYAFIKRGIGDYLFMKVMFAFFDLSEPVLLFWLDYAAVMVLVATIGYCMQTVMRKNRKNDGGE